MASQQVEISDHSGLEEALHRAQRAQGAGRRDGRDAPYSATRTAQCGEVQLQVRPAREVMREVPLVDSRATLGCVGTFQSPPPIRDVSEIDVKREPRRQGPTHAQSTDGTDLR